MGNSQRQAKHQLEKQYDISSFFDFAALKGNEESIGGKSSYNPCSTSLEGKVLVDNDAAINNQTSGCGGMLGSTLTRISNEEKRAQTAPWRSGNIPTLWEYKGEQLFGYSLRVAELQSSVILLIIDKRTGAWKRYKAAIKGASSEACVLLLYLGHTEEQVHSPLLRQVMRDIEAGTKKQINEEKILKKIHRASVDLSEIKIERIKLKTIIEKNPKVSVNMTLRQMENQAL
ncbi:MAG: hypothetical protein EZS28_030153 [Streblomastix strix]|uniref:Uncharacterized protein n=1 Tax=Streblomastix strix TaxID=222440 RepID=A0A5J4UWN9_9EUKA|nr:MAG: hypothetical protein EZS28_030153 [Streblomastix strix]